MHGNQPLSGGVGPTSPPGPLLEPWFSKYISLSSIIGAIGELARDSQVGAPPRSAEEEPPGVGASRVAGGVDFPLVFMVHRRLQRLPRSHKEALSPLTRGDHPRSPRIHS